MSIVQKRSLLQKKKVSFEKAPLKLFFHFLQERLLERDERWGFSGEVGKEKKLYCVLAERVRKRFTVL